MTIVHSVAIRMYISQLKAMIKGNICTELKGRAATFKEQDTNLDAYKKSR
jgi:hypothetical protein